MRTDAAKFDGDLAPWSCGQQAAIHAVEKAVDWIVANFAADPKAPMPVPCPSCSCWHYGAGGWQMGRQR